MIKIQYFHAEYIIVFRLSQIPLCGSKSCFRLIKLKCINCANIKALLREIKTLFAGFQIGFVGIIAVQRSFSVGIGLRDGTVKILFGYILC